MKHLKGVTKDARHHWNRDGRWGAPPVNPRFAAAQRTAERGDAGGAAARAPGSAAAWLTDAPVPREAYAAADWNAAARLAHEDAAAWQAAATPARVTAAPAPVAAAPAPGTQAAAPAPVAAAPAPGTAAFQAWQAAAWQATAPAPVAVSGCRYQDVRLLGEVPWKASAPPPAAQRPPPPGPPNYPPPQGAGPKARGPHP